MSTKIEELLEYRYSSDKLALIKEKVKPTSRGRLLANLLF